MCKKVQEYENKNTVVMLKNSRSDLKEYRKRKYVQQ